VGTLVLAAVTVATTDAAAEDAGTRAPSPPPSSTAPARAADVVPPDLDDVEHMCALLTSCERLPLPSGVVPKDFVGCTRTLYAELASPAAAMFSLTLRECGLRASSCGELRTCALRGAKADVCAGRGKAGPVDMCDGDGRAITCNTERVTLVRDCPRGGEQCVVRDGHAVCALGACDKDGPAACSASGTRVVECKKGKLVSMDCAAFGLRCVTTGEGPRCATTQGATCSEGTSRCDGSTTVGCWHGHEVRVACGARGLACGAENAAEGAQVVGACRFPAPARPTAAASGGPGPGAPDAGRGACDPSAAPRCAGANLEWCAWGQPRSYLCKSLGLSRCVADAQGARCAP